MNNRKMRLLSGIVCTMLIVVMFVSLFYIVKEENHQCTALFAHVYIRRSKS